MKSQSKQKTSKSCPQPIQELIDQAKNTRMYLLKRAGPSSLKICDEDGNKFKVELSSNMICSCNQSNQHCIHTIHALLKVFQVDENNPIIWQQSYSQYEITNILNGSYKAKQEPIKKQAPIKQQAPQQRAELQQEESQNRQQITEDDMCPICQEGLLCNEALVYCKKQCQNYFHAKCMKVWVMQKQSAGKKINCPMCRVDWGESALVDIRQEEKNFENLYKTHNKTCHTCKISPIVGSLFSCISCANFHLCEKCHHKKNHPHIFMVKKTRADNFEFINNESLNSLIYIFPENLQANNGETGGLMLIGMGFQKQSKCQFCQKSKQLRLLSCGHIADDDCLRKMKEHYFICPIDYQTQFPGLFNMLTKEQKQFHMAETKKWNIIKEEDLASQSYKLPPINRPSMNRPKQLSQRHFENLDPKKKQVRQHSAKKQENPLQIKSLKQKIEFTL